MKAKAILYTLIGLACVSSCLYVGLRAGSAVYRLLDLEPAESADDGIIGMIIIIAGILVLIFCICAAYEVGKFIMEELLRNSPPNGGNHDP